MVTKQKTRDVFDEKGYNKVTSSYDWRCLSSDTKPTDGVYVNDLLLELDTGNKFYFDGTQWQTFGGSSN